MATLKTIKNHDDYLTAAHLTGLAGVSMDENRNSISLLNFKFQTANALVKYDLQDGFVDEYEDASGVDASASATETYDASSDLYKPYFGNYFGDSSLGTCQFGTSAVTQSGESVDIDDVLTTGTESGGSSANTYGATTTTNDGAVPNPVAGCYEFTVSNVSGAYDGDMVVLNFAALTVDNGVTITTKQPCRGMLVYVKGDASISGAISMNCRGAHADPTTSGGGDTSAVSSTGVKLAYLKSGGTDTLAAADFAGTGTASVAAVANNAAVSSDGTTWTVNRAGAAGAPASGGGCGTRPCGGPGNPGSNGGTGQSGGGGGSGWSACYYCSGGGPGGAAGTIFSGGPSQGGQPNGGQGGGWGNPDAGGSAITTGTGGLLFVIVGGDLTVAATGKIVARGGYSGGGNVIVLYAGTLSNSGSITADKHTGSLAGSGSTQSSTIDSPGTGLLILKSNAFTAAAGPNTLRILLFYQPVGTPTLNTDVKGFVSRDGGASYYDCTLADEGTYETSRNLVAGSATCDTDTAYVDVTANGTSNFILEGSAQPAMTLVEGVTYRFDQSESTNTGHPLRFATAADAAGSAEYTTGVTSSGTPGSAAAYTQIVVASGAPDLFYYCTAHAGMGAAATTGTTLPVSIKYKVKALNGEDYRLHGTSVMWATS